MVDSEKTRDVHASPCDVGPHRKQNSPWFVAALVLMVCLFAVALFHRNWIRAQWWAIRLTNTENMNEQTYFANSLAAVGQDSMGATQRLARHERPTVRTLAIHILDRIPGDDATDELERLLADEDTAVRSSAALALGLKASLPGGNGIVQRLMASSRSANINAATAATTALERIHQPEVIETLCTIAREHKAPAARAQAVESLATTLQSAPERLASPTDISSEECDPFMTLVEALTDSASFSGRLSFERQMDAITAQATLHIYSTPIPPKPAPTTATSIAPLTRTVAQIAADALSRLTGESITPATSPNSVLTETQRADFADHYRRLASLQEPPPILDPAQMRPEALPFRAQPE